ncbi:MAG: AAA family ATPase [Hyphomicrobiales bacterium]|nr:AAA family ATPase [Hyphomicrobiales bacterium]
MSSSPCDSDDPQAEVFLFLADPRTHGLDETVGRIDTAGAVVFLAGPGVYKVKRAVRFPFMDLSTLEKRHRACEAEIAVNREIAPGIYLDALPIVRKGKTLAIGGAGEAIEWVTHMRRFDENATLDRIADRDGVPGAIIDKLALAIRRSHAQAPLRDAAAAAHAIETYIEQNDAAFAERPDLFPASKARRLTQDSRLVFAIARPVMLARGAAGFTRRCHGDLHLRNIVLIGGEPTLFDAVEFSDEVASGDVLYDLAFLLMDLEERGLRGAANRILNRYLAPEPPEALGGLAALPLFLSLRAAIRAKVEAAGADRLDGEPRDKALALARRYFDSAAGFLRYVPPRLVAVGGLSGAGKSALAAALAPRLGRAPGALWLRSDVERKAMFGVDETTHLPDSAYEPEVTRDVYQVIHDKARRALRAGQAVVLDATFSTVRERGAASAVAADVGVAFDGLFLEAPLETRLQRVAAREADASDADAAIACGQRAEPLGEKGWTALDAAGARRETIALALGRLRCAP